MINFWSHSAEFWPFPALWLVEQFPYISVQTAEGIDLKLGRHIHYGTPQAWLTFGHAPLNFHSFLAFDYGWWLGSFSTVVTHSGLVHHMATKIWVNIGSGNGLLPESTKPLPDHQWSPVTFILG